METSCEQQGNSKEGTRPVSVPTPQTMRRGGRSKTSGRRSCCCWRFNQSISLALAHSITPTISQSVSGLVCKVVQARNSAAMALSCGSISTSSSLCCLSPIACTPPASLACHFPLRGGYLQLESRHLASSLGNSSAQLSFSGSLISVSVSFLFFRF